MWVPNVLLSSTRKPADMKSRSRNRNCCWKKTDRVSLSASKGVDPCATPFSSRYSSPTELVDHLPMWKWFSSSASRRSTVLRAGNSHGGNGHCSAGSGRSVNLK